MDKKSQSPKLQDQGSSPCSPANINEYETALRLLKGLYLHTPTTFGNHCRWCCYALPIHDRFCLYKEIEAFLNAINKQQKDKTMYDSRFKKQEVFIIDYDDLDDLINKTYSKPSCTYEFVAAEECNNYSSKHYNIDEKDKLNKWEQEILDHWIAWSKASMPSARTMLIDMKEKGLVPMGKIIVEVFW